MQRQGFSLVELSIVLVILGLLTGGILAGQSLIRASELRAVNTEYERYTAAVGTFRDKYFNLPGDVTATVTLFTTAGGGLTGNGQIDGSATAANNETAYFWIDLAQAGLVEGNYANNDWTVAPTVGTNVPRSKMGQGAWYISYVGPVVAAGANGYYAGNYANAFLFAKATTLNSPAAASGLLKSEEAWNIDTKMDDGLPASGSVTALQAQGSATAGAGCGNNTTAATTTAYDLTNTNRGACSLVFKSGY